VATFATPSNAIRGALAIRDGARHLHLRLRAGLHVGEIQRRDDDISGIAVHVAARVGALAGAGEVVVSGTVVDLVEGSGITFDDRGLVSLKGVPEPRQLWTVVDG
jgi:class 3 adenylate cyclase